MKLSLIVSSAHIQQKDNNLLYTSVHDVNLGAIVYELGEYGYMIYVREFASNSTLKAIGFSKDFINLVKLAQDNNCEYLRIDRDGPLFDELPTFEW
jgi:hypothetical protein